VSDDLSDWTFDLNAGSWLYDPASTSIERWEADNGYSSPVPLPEGTRPQLDVDDIATYFERTFGSLLNCAVSLGKMWRDDLLNYGPHGLLTFGAIVEFYGRDVLAHFPSTPPPEWHFESRSCNIKAKYSGKGVPTFISSYDSLLSNAVYSRVDFRSTNIHEARINLRFSLRLLLKDRDRLREAYLSQHNSSKVSSIIYLIDEVGFSLIGKFPHNHTSSPPAYLFVPPLCVEHIDGMYCVHAPLPDPPFYWTLDPEGKVTISDKDWEKYGIPELEVREWIGSFWWDDEYNIVETYLHKKGYESDGKQYARDHGYPKLIRGDPHDRRMTELEDSDDEDLGDEEPSPSRSQLASPSAFSLIDTPTKSEVVHEEKCSIPALLVKGFGLWTKKNGTNIL
ncbi:hypothetical protein AAF712_013243, partial [Marasmius tenuissimus]